MIKLRINNFNYRWDIILLTEIMFTVLFTGFFPEDWHNSIYPIMFVLLYFTAAFELQNRRTPTLSAAFVLMSVAVASAYWNWPVLAAVSKSLNFLFFAFIVANLIMQIANATMVTKRVILQAINGYLLLGIVFTFLIGLMVQYDPAAFNFSQASTTRQADSFYFGFVTFATLGYGDFIPLKPYSKSLAVLIAVSGQLYVAVIIALLVGKFSSQSISAK